MFWRTTLASLFITSFSVGIGLASLPAVITLTGFWQSLLICCLISCFIVITSLIYGDVVLSFPDGANIPSILRSSPGKVGITIISILFIYTHYSILAEYYVTAPVMLQQLSQYYLGLSFSPLFYYIVISFALCTLILLGPRIFFTINSISVTAIFILSFYVVYITPENTTPISQSGKNWVYSILALPLFYNGLFCQSIIPTVATFLKRSWFHMKIAIYSSGILACMTYILWLIIVNDWMFKGNIVTEVFVSFDFINQNLNSLSSISTGELLIFIALFLSICDSTVAINAILLDFFRDLFKISLDMLSKIKRVYLYVLILFATYLYKFIAPTHYKGLFDTGFDLAIIGALLPVVLMLSSRLLQRDYYKPIFNIRNNWLFIIFIISLALLYLEFALLFTSYIV